MPRLGYNYVLLLLNHAIATLDPEARAARGHLLHPLRVSGDGEPLALSRIELALERAGFHTQHVEGFREDYAITLRRWTERLDERLAEAAPNNGGAGEEGGLSPPVPLPRQQWWGLGDSFGLSFHTLSPRMRAFGHF